MHNLLSVNIPNKLEKIGFYVFAGCSKLLSIRIPKSVTGIEYSAFRRCSSLASISVAEANPVYTSTSTDGTRVEGIIEKSSNTLILGCRNTVIPDSVTVIGSNAFAGSEGIKLTIPESNVS